MADEGDLVLALGVQTLVVQHEEPRVRLQQVAELKWWKVALNKYFMSTHMTKG